MGKTRRARCKRNQKGGGPGGGWEFEPSPAGNIINNDIAWKSIGNCRELPAVARPGFIDGGYSGPKGLPGMSAMSGGRRKNHSRRSHKNHSRRSHKNHSRRRMRGGRYMVGEPDGVGMGAPWGSGIPPTLKVPCEPSHTSIPPDNASDSLNRIGSEIWDGPIPPPGTMNGGASAPALHNVSNPNSESYIVPTAGYTNLQNPSDVIRTSAGTLEMVNIPENARTMNPDCLKSGGGRRASRKNLKNLKNRNNRNNRKSRKGKGKGSRK